eukprot:10240094-Lingulodinium_polyedra.AAC.1
MDAARRLNDPVRGRCEEPAVKTVQGTLSVQLLDAAHRALLQGPQRVLDLGLRHNVLAAVSLTT